MSDLVILPEKCFDINTLKYYSIPSDNFRVTYISELTLTSNVDKVFLFQFYDNLKLRNEVEILSYPLLLEIDRLPFSTKNLPTKFSKFYNQVITELIFSLPKNKVNIKYGQFSFLKLPQDKIYYLIKTTKLHPRDILNNLFFQNMLQEKHKKELLFRDWLILTQKFGSINFSLADRLYSYNEEFYNNFVNGNTGYYLIDKSVEFLLKNKILPISLLKILLEFFFKVYHLPVDLAIDFFSRSLGDNYESLWEGGLIYHHAEILGASKKSKKFSFNYMSIEKHFSRNYGNIFRKVKEARSSMEFIEKRLKLFNEKYRVLNC